MKYDTRAKIAEQARRILDRAEAEGRDLTPEEQEEFDRLLGLLNSSSRPQDPVAAHAYQPGEGDPYVAPETRAALMRARDPDYARAFWRVVRNWRYPDPEDLRVVNAPETRALVLGTDAAGGFLVPESFEREIVKKLSEFNVMRTVARVLTLTSDHKIPVEGDIGSAAWIPEGGQYPESDPSFEQRVLSAHKLGRITLVSEELLADSAVDLEQYLADVFARSLGTAEEEAFVAGDGNGKPRGIILDAPVGLTAASATAIAADEVIRLFHSLPRPYRSRATWLMSDNTAMQLRLLKDSNGQYLWQPGLQAGQPDRLLGRPVAISNAMPGIEAGARSILFGDLSYYWVAERQGRVLQILREKYADTGRVGFRMYQRVDGVLVLPDAVRVLEHPAA